MAAQAPTVGGAEPPLATLVGEARGQHPDRAAAVVGPRGWEAAALLPPGWTALDDLSAARAWAEGLDVLWLARVTRPGLERIEGQAAIQRRLARLRVPKRVSLARDARGPWVRVVDVGGGVRCLREPLALLAPSLDTDWVNAYLIVGRDRALLFDVGCGIVDYGALARSLTDKPLVAVLSHGDWDHAGGRGPFSEYWCHPADIPILRGRAPVGFLRQRLTALRRPEAEAYDVPRDTEGMRPLADGQRFDLGGVTLEVLHLPGHVPGQVGLWDAARGLLFSGDMAYVGPIYVTDLPAFTASAGRLAALSGVRAVLGGHGPVPAAATLLLALPDACRRLDGGVPIAGGRFAEARFTRFSLVLPRDAANR